MVVRVTQLEKGEGSMVVTVEWTQSLFWHLLALFGVAGSKFADFLFFLIHNRGHDPTA
jgi:hypothetical protein